MTLRKRTNGASEGGCRNSFKGTSLGSSMALWSTLVLFGIALVLVVKSSDYFVHFAAKIAKRFGVSEFVIGLTLVAIGTSLPELTNAAISAVLGVNEIALGNVLGSNMANLGLSIGFSILLATITVTPRIYRREVLVLLASTTLFILASLDGVISGSEGAAFVLLFLFYLGYVSRIFGTLERSVRPAELNYFVEYVGRAKEVVSLQRMQERYNELQRGAKRFAAAWTGRALLDMFGVIASAGVLIYAADLLVGNAVRLAALLGITSAGVGATIVAVGTTMPELSVSIASVRKGYHRMLIGNIIGSNIVNVMLVIGVTAAILPLQVPLAIMLAAYPLLVASVAFFAYILLRKGTVPKWAGALLLGLYLVFLALMWFL